MYIKKGYLYSLAIRELNAFRSRLTVNYSGLENICNRGYTPTIYAVNHPTRFDPFIMIPSILHYSDNKNMIRLPAAQWIKEKFHYLDMLKFFDWLAISFVGDDKEKNKPALQQLEDHLQKYKQILIFPEGWYQRDGKMRPGKYGTSIISLHCAQEEDVFLLPTAITYYMKPRPRKRELVRSFWNILWNFDEYLLDTVVEAKQYYRAELDINFGKPISVMQIKQQGVELDEAGLRRLVTTTMMKEIGHLVVINANHLLAQYLLMGYASQKRVYEKEELQEDILSLTSLLCQKGFHVKAYSEESLEQALQLFQDEHILSKKKVSGIEKYIVDKNCKIYFEKVPDPMDEDFKDKNFLHYTANQIQHLEDVCNLIEQRFH